MPKFKLNGQETEFKEGEFVIEAAARAGVPIPHYCYHPDLSSPANCRMCLVEMEGAPKLIPSCQWTCNEKMSILTDTPKVEQAQADVMEYLLINHPLDCPICDQAGECKLQQYAYLFGRPSSSMEEAKVELEKRKVVGPHVVLDQERCISCTRCVRFCEEITGTGELAMAQRGHRTSVDSADGKDLLARGYSGNVADMCPVGALTIREFRFEARVWYLQAQDTTCTLCSRGCNLTADWRGERGRRAEVKRTRARRNPAVNASWICDEGRFGHHEAVAEGRPTRARGGSEGSLEQAWGAASALLRENEGATGWLGVLASGSETCEELAALKALAVAADAKAALVVPGFEDADEDGILRRTDKAANRTGARRLGWSADAKSLAGRRVMIAVDADLRPDAGLGSEHLEATKGAHLIALVAHRRGWAASAEVMLPLANAFEKDGTVINFENVLQRIARCVPAPGDARDALRHAVALAEGAGLAPVALAAESQLACLAASGGPFAGLDLSRLEQWGARLLDDGGVEYLEEPPPLFTSAPHSYAEGEYLPFRRTSTPPPAVHVAAGAPTRIRMRDESAGRGVAMTTGGDRSAEDAGEDS